MSGPSVSDGRKPGSDQRARGATGIRRGQGRSRCPGSPNTQREKGCVGKRDSGEVPFHFAVCKIFDVYMWFNSDDNDSRAAWDTHTPVVLTRLTHASIHMVQKLGGQQRTRLYCSGGSNVVGVPLGIEWVLAAERVFPVVEQAGKWRMLVLLPAVRRPRAPWDCLSMLRCNPSE